MKDGFDKNVAEKMPRIQKRPNRPWNVDPVLLKTEPAETPAPAASAAKRTEPTRTETQTPPTAVLAELPTSIKRTENTIAEINTQFTHMLMEKQEVRRVLDQKQQEIEQAHTQNTILTETLTALQGQISASAPLSREISFLHEQLQDADFYIQNLTGQLTEKTQIMAEQEALRAAQEEKAQRMASELKGMAMLDVKASMLERDLSAAQVRIQELEVLLEEEHRSRLPLEEEIVELKTALDRVHTSLSQIRLKAKREAYGV